jgi:hypothetical protein
MGLCGLLLVLVLTRRKHVPWWRWRRCPDSTGAASAMPRSHRHLAAQPRQHRRRQALNVCLAAVRLAGAP